MVRISGISALHRDGGIQNTFHQVLCKEGPEEEPTLEKETKRRKLQESAQPESPESSESRAQSCHSKRGANVLFHHLLEAVPDLGGRLVSFLFEDLSYSEALQQRRKSAVLWPDLRSLMLASSEVQLALIVGVKNRRKDCCGPSQGYQETLRYSKLCDILAKTCPNNWARSRKVRLYSTLRADEEVARCILLSNITAKHAETL